MAQMCYWTIYVLLVSMDNGVRLLRGGMLRGLLLCTCSHLSACAAICCLVTAGTDPSAGANSEERAPQHALFCYCHALLLSLRHSMVACILSFDYA
jgi:hypothetical protein